MVSVKLPAQWLVHGGQQHTSGGVAEGLCSQEERLLAVAEMAIWGLQCQIRSVFLAGGKRKVAPQYRW